MADLNMYIFNLRLNIVMIEYTTLMSQKDDCFNDHENPGNTLDTGTTSVI